MGRGGTDWGSMEGELKETLEATEQEGNLGKRVVGLQRLVVWPLPSYYSSFVAVPFVSLSGRQDNACFLICGLQTHLKDIRKHSSPAHSPQPTRMFMPSYRLAPLVMLWSSTLSWVASPGQTGSECPQLKEHESWQKLRLKCVLLAHSSHKTLAPPKLYQFLPCLQLRPCLFP